MLLALTCQSGLESLVRRESEKLGLEKVSVRDRIISGVGDMSTLMKLCMGSRFANRVYRVVSDTRITDFDALFTLVRSEKWDEYFFPDTQIVVDAVSTRSILTSIPKIQSIIEKAIHESMNAGSGEGEREIHILALLVEDRLSLMIDVTGEPLHKRGYRTEAGEAPIKESLASGLVALSGWKYQEPLWDPCCGSGTIVIESALLARNRAPNLERSFRFMILRGYDPVIHNQVRDDLIAREYHGKYLIYASDHDAHMVDIARENAHRAGVSDDIRFFVAPVSDPFPYLPRTPFIVTNPPYGKRMNPSDLTSIYRSLDTKIEEGSGGAYITSYFSLPMRRGWRNRKLLNGADECRFWIYEGSPHEKNLQ